MLLRWKKYVSVEFSHDTKSQPSRSRTKLERHKRICDAQLGASASLSIFIGSARFFYSGKPRKQGIIQYREIVVAPWRILYQIDEKVVHIVLIVLVVDGRRNLEDVLFNRIMR